MVGATGLTHARDATDVVHAGTAQIRQIGKHGIDHQSLVVVVFAQVETNFVAGDGIAGLDNSLFTGDVLINHRLLQSQIAARQLQDDVAVGVETRLGTGQTERNLLGVGAGRDDKVVLQLTLIAVKHRIDARVDALVLHFAVGSDSAAPLLRVVPNVIVGYTCQLIGAGNPSC